MVEMEKREAATGAAAGGGKVEEEERLFTVLDFDMLCSTVAMQTQNGKWNQLNIVDDCDETDMLYSNGGVLRMWEGELLYDCFEDRQIALQSACCPCFRFGKNMRRAGFGSCFLQGSVYFMLVVVAILNVLAFLVTERRCFIYLAAAFTISVGAYLGFYRTQIRKKFNIRGNDSMLDDCVYHLICPCCSLCQESRTLEMNNVQDGTWHGRGDTICIGSYSEGSKAIFELAPPPILSTKYPQTQSTTKSAGNSSHEARQTSPLV
ncbi:hypothetical protein M9H77_25711 [Catharanthus roseus]|uniref:Uncharacterized protein n=1 Tax=Catharanthus roseus TaxID=4058 RepID=A0ACC0ABW2_CATRO|nr:hypothetical protein M9H77_25711 [Catharanthus roseus]